VIFIFIGAFAKSRIAKLTLFTNFEDRFYAKELYKDEDGDNNDSDKKESEDYKKKRMFVGT